MPTYRQSPGTSLRDVGLFITDNPVIAGRHAAEANQRANAYQEATTGATNQAVEMRRAAADREQQVQAAQSQAMQDFYKQPAETRGPVDKFVAPRLATIDPSKAMAMTQNVENRELEDSAMFLDMATKDPQAAIAFARSKNMPIDPGLQQMIGNRYYATQLNEAFKLAQGQYGNRVDLIQKALRTSANQILGSMAAAKKAGQPLPDAPMGFSLDSMPAAPPPKQTAGYGGVSGPALRKYYDQETGREQYGMWDPATRSFVPVGGTKAPSAGKAVSSTDLLKHAKQIEDYAMEVTKRSYPELWERDWQKNETFSPEFYQKFEETRAQIEQQYPAPAGQAAPAPAPDPDAGGGQPYEGDEPPPDYPDAQRGSDGVWRVQQDGQWFAVVE